MALLIACILIDQFGLPVAYYGVATLVFFAEILFMDHQLDYRFKGLRQYLDLHLNQMQSSIDDHCNGLRLQIDTVGDVVNDLESPYTKGI